MQKKTFQEKAKIVANNKLGGNYYKLVLGTKQIAPASSPGQFVQVKVSDEVMPLLRRPFSIHRVLGGTIQKAGKLEIIYEVVGKASEILSQKKPGQILDIIGPLGNGFDYKAQDRLPILVAGGMGVAPLGFLSEKLVTKKPLVLIGARTKSQVLCAREFRKLGCKVKIATDDGSAGFKGRITQLLNNILRSTRYNIQYTIYACGPRPMLREISRLARERHIPAQLSMEEHMSCGFGACLGCVVNTLGGFKRVCKEGPVFDAQEIVWEHPILSDGLVFTTVKGE